MAKGSRGGKRANKGGGVSNIGILDANLNESKAGATYNSLPKNFKDNIKNNLKLSQAMRDNISNGNNVNLSDEWTTGKGKDKIKIITEFDGKRLNYTVKQRNKIIVKTTSKERVATNVAMFYKKIFNL